MKAVEQKTIVFQRADAYHDGVLNREEFHQIFVGDEEPQFLRIRILAYFLDFNKDGVISADGMKNLIVFSLAGFLFSAVFTRDLLHQSTISVMVVTGRSVEKSLKPAVNILTAVAILYLLSTPWAYWSMLSELVFFILSGALGFWVWVSFMYRKHGRIAK